MAIFVTGRAVDFNTDFEVLQNLANKSSYTQVSATFFHVPANVAGGSTIDVGKSFAGAPPLVTGSISGIGITTASGSYGMIGLQSFSLDAVISALGQSTATALFQFFGVNDDITGSAGNDVLLGFNGMDTIHAGDGDDNVSGNAHDDTLFGEGGNDEVLGGHGMDVLDGGEGVDEVRYHDKSDPVELLLKGPFATTVFVNGVVEDTIKNFENARGGFGADWLRGTDGANLLYGRAGDDTLGGGVGKDELTGDDGSDRFVFDVKAKGKNADHVVDFDADTIAMDNDVFKSLKDGKLKGKYFETGKAADDANDFVIFDKKKDKLYYDGDGDGAANQKLVATFDNDPNLKAGDVLVI